MTRDDILINRFLLSKLFILIVLSCSLFMFGSFTESNSEILTNVSSKGSRSGWTEKQKIKAGYLYFYDNTRHITEIKNSGLNTIIVKAWQFDKKQILQTLNSLKNWGRACFKHDLHMVVAYNWQPQKIQAKFRPATFADGSEAKFACPLDENFWERHLSQIGVQIALMSIDPELPIDGLLIDLEMYGTERLPSNLRNYSLATCYCDECFSRFVNKNKIKTYDLQRNERERFLVSNLLYEDYHEYLNSTLRNIAKQYEEALHSINPRLTLGVYPFTRNPNWVILNIARQFGKPEKQVLLCAVDTYYQGGHKNIPEQYESILTVLGINGLYVPGYLFRKYSSSMISENIVRSIEKADGYWLYKLPQLWNNYPDKNELLANGTQKEYWESIRRANRMSVE